MDKLIIHDNKACQFITDDQDLFRILRSTLSYKTVGVEYTEAYKRGWNGIVYLLNKSGYFYSGLFTKVKDILNERNAEFEISDLRKPLTINPPLDISNNLKKIGIVPRDYQENISNICLNNRKGIVRACTGSGKSIILALTAAKINKPTIIYVIGLDLLKQFHDLFSKLFDEPIGYIGDGICNIERINIASIWTIGRALNINKKDIYADEEEDSKEKFNESQVSKILTVLEQTKFHGIDECHVVTTNTVSAIYKKIDPEYIFGFSGTPFRDDNTDLLINGILGEQIVDLSASELISRNILAQPIIKFYSVPPMSFPLAQYQTVYKSYIVDNIVRNTLIIHKTKELLDKKYVPLVLFKQIKHGKILFDMMQEAGIKCEMLYGNDSLDRRTEVKEMIESGKIQVILASTIFDLGVDLPILSALILCGGGKSSIKSLQRIGRVIRGYKNKKFAAIVEFYDQVKFLKKHSLIRAETYSSERGFKILLSPEMKR